MNKKTRSIVNSIKSRKAAYVPHIGFALFGAFIGWWGIASSTEAIRLALVQGIENPDWKSGLWMIFFGSVLIGASFANVAHIVVRSKNVAIHV